MNVRELIGILETMDPDLEVKFAYNYGDHWRTTVAADINQAEEGVVQHSAYHDMDKVVDENEDEELRDEDKERTVVILS